MQVEGRIGRLGNEFVIFINKNVLINDLITIQSWIAKKDEARIVVQWHRDNTIAYICAKPKRNVNIADLAFNLGEELGCKIDIPQELKTPKVLRPPFYSMWDSMQNYSPPPMRWDYTYYPSPASAPPR